VGYEEVEGQDGTIKAETCEKCGSYLKVLYQNKAAALDPVADDVASLGLDQLLRGGAYRRAGANPFLTGY
jgi:FdhE protein